MEKLEEELKGENIGMVDIVAGFITYLIPVYEEVGSMKLLDSSRFPAITGWIDDFLKHPLIKDNNDLPSKEKIITYVQKRSKEIAARKPGSTNRG